MDDWLNAWTLNGCTHARCSRFHLPPNNNDNNNKIIRSVLLFHIILTYVLVNAFTLKSMAAGWLAGWLVGRSVGWGSSFIGAEFIIKIPRAARIICNICRFVWTAQENRIGWVHRWTNINSNYCGFHILMRSNEWTSLSGRNSIGMVPTIATIYSAILDPCTRLWIRLLLHKILCARVHRSPFKRWWWWTTWTRWMGSARKHIAPKHAWPLDTPAMSRLTLRLRSYVSF